MPVAVEVDGLRKAYGPVRAVDGVTFRVETGEIFAILGPNGAGKTTTIEILEGFRRRDGGDVRVLGEDPADRRAAARLRGRTGVVLQELAVEPYLTVREVLTRAAGLYRAPRRVSEVISLVGLDDKADSRVKKLSGGQQRRLDVGLGIVGRPDLLYLDEPTTGLDPAGRRATWDVVRRLAGEGTTVVLTSHYMDEVEALADQVVVIAGGRVVAAGAPASIGGRDVGQATIRFRLPGGVLPAALPLAVQALRDGTVEVRTEEEVEALHRLTGWALDNGVALAGLRVDRVTLEDVYLRLVGATTEGAAPPEPAREPA